jgi:hypothetical protein
MNTMPMARRSSEQRCVRAEKYDNDKSNHLQAIIWYFMFARAGRLGFVGWSTLMDVLLHERCIQ